MFRCLPLLALLMLLGCADAQKVLEEVKRKGDEAFIAKPKETAGSAAPQTNDGNDASAPDNTGPGIAVTPPTSQPSDAQLMAEWNGLHAASRSDAALQRLATLSPEGLNGVTELDLAGTGMRVGLEGFKTFGKFPLLKRLCLNDCPVDTAKLALICELTQLEILELQRTGITDPMMAPLSKLATLRTLDISSNSNVTDQGLAAIRNLVEVETLILSRTQVQGTALAKAKYLGNLKHLEARETPFREGMAALKSSPRLEVLDLGSTTITDVHLQALSGIKGLTECSLDTNPAITDQGFTILKGNGKLERLNLTGTAVSSRSFNQLRSYKKLQYLAVPLDDPSKTALRKALPNCTVE